MPTDDTKKPSEKAQPLWWDRFVKKVIAAHGGTNFLANCPSCATPGKMGINVEAWSLLSYKVGDDRDTAGTGAPGRYFPVAAVICANCGYSRSYNLLILGVLDSDGKLRND